MLFGTPEYMAPEQARGEKPDHRVDVYAMGCLLFQFLVGSVPFKADSFMAILTQHMVEPVPAIGPELLARSGAPSGIIAAVNKALAKDREERFADIESLAKAVREAAQGVAVAPTSPHSRKRPGSQGMDWTGSVRAIDAIVEDEVEQEEEFARLEASPPGSRNLVFGLVAAVVVGIGAFAVSSVLGGGESKPEPAIVEQPKTQVLPADNAGAAGAAGQVATPSGVTATDSEVSAADAALAGEATLKPAFPKVDEAKPNSDVKPRTRAKPEGASAVNQDTPPNSTAVVAKPDVKPKDKGTKADAKVKAKADEGTPVLGDVVPKDPFK